VLGSVTPEESMAKKRGGLKKGAKRERERVTRGGETERTTGNHSSGV